MTLSQTLTDAWTAETFVAWSEAQPKRHELLDGMVFAMSSEQAGHARLKFAIQTQFAGQISSKKMPCEVFPDGMAVRIDKDTVFEPDALVRCGPRLHPKTILILDPVIVVEIASPSTQRLDTSLKFTRYFRNASIMHYLIVVADSRTIIHHERVGEHVHSSNHTTGTIRLVPPDLDLDVEALFASALDGDPE